MSKLIGYSWTDEQIKFIVDLKNQGYTYADIADEFNSEFKKEILKEKSPENIRLQYIKYADMDFSDDELISNMSEKRNSAERSGKLAKENKVLLDKVLTQKSFISELKEINKQCPIKVHKKITKKASKKKTKRTLVGHISDTHIGAMIYKDEMDDVNEFNPLIASRRFAMFFKEFCNYKRQYRKDTDAILVLNGDILDGIIHNQEWGCLPMTTQFAVAQRILIQGISYVANNFSSVKVYCTMGNHSRFIHKGNKGRQSFMKWDGFGTMLYLAIKDTLEKTHKNVTVEIPKTPYSVFKVQGHTVFATHGDNVISVGNISSKIDIKRITNQISNISLGLNIPIDIAMVGHVHKITHQHLDNGTELMVNGPLSGNSPYGTSLGYFVNAAAQQIFESTPDYPVGDVRFVKLEEADDMKELDKIIEPIKGWF